MKSLIILAVTLFINASVARGETFIETLVDPSTGEQLYACNASIQHSTPLDLQECLNLSTGEVCDPKNLKPGGEACVCRTKRSLGDSITAVDSKGKLQTSIAGESMRGLVEDNKSFVNKLSRIDINLGSEDYGSEYSVRFCYLGPQELKQKKSSGKGGEGETTIDLSEGKYRVDFSISGMNYHRALDKVSFNVVCDQRFWGTHMQARKSTDLTPPSGLVESDYGFNHVFLGQNPNETPDSIEYMRQDLMLNNNPSMVPRFCVFEFRFKEKSGPRLKRDPQFSNGNFIGKIRVCKLENCPPSL